MAQVAAATTSIVVMGVSGCGKTTLGEALAQRLGVPFEDADDLHPASNVAKMHAGIPLTDEDRAPWLVSVGAWIAGHEATGSVMACSALKRAYRDHLRAEAGALFFVHPFGGQALIEERVSHREGHFMPASLVASQLATLEQLEPGEDGLTLRADQPLEEQVAQALAAIEAYRRPTA